jgi:hypothetical protein
MAIFGVKKKADVKTSEGKSFLAVVRAEYDALFARFVADADEYDSVEAYTDALAAEAWEITEGVVKQSYRNGVRRGQGKRSTA